MMKIWTCVLCMLSKNAKVVKNAKFWFVFFPQVVQKQTVGEVGN